MTMASAPCCATVFEMLDDVLHVDARELAIGKRPGVTVEILDVVLGGIRVRVDADGVGRRLALGAPDVEGRCLSL
jgi:hypothetical protein